MQQTAERVRKRENVNGNEQHQQDGVIDMNTPVRSNNEFDADTLNEQEAVIISNPSYLPNKTPICVLMIP